MGAKGLASMEGGTGHASVGGGMGHASVGRGTGHAGTGRGTGHAGMGRGMERAGMGGGKGSRMGPGGKGVPPAKESATGGANTEGPCGKGPGTGDWGKLHGPGHAIPIRAWESLGPVTLYSWAHCAQHLS